MNKKLIPLENPEYQMKKLEDILSIGKIYYLNSMPFAKDKVPVGRDKTISIWFHWITGVLISSDPFTSLILSDMYINKIFGGLMLSDFFYNNESMFKIADYKDKAEVRIIEPYKKEVIAPFLVKMAINYAITKQKGLVINEVASHRLSSVLKEFGFKENPIGYYDPGFPIYPDYVYKPEEASGSFYEELLKYFRL